MTVDIDQATELELMGPVDYLILEFPGNRMTGEAFPMLIDLVDRGIIRILDLAFIRKESDGTVTMLSQVDLERMRVLELALFDGAASGLLGQDDLDEAAKALEPEAIDLAVGAAVRHRWTRYDELLMAGWDRNDARAEVWSDVTAVLERWRGGGV